MFRSKLSVAALIVLTLLLSNINRASAGGSSPNVLVYTSNGEPNGAYMTTFAPDGTTTGKIAVLDGTTVNVSPSLQWYSVTNPNAEPKLQYAPLTNFVPGALTPIKIDAGFDLVGAQFNWDSAYLLYTLTRLDPAQYIVGILELQTGKQVEYTEVSNPPAQPPIPGAAGPLFYDSQSGRLVLNTFAPYSSGGSQGLFEVNIGSFAALQPGSYPLPSAHQIAKAGQYSGYGGPQPLSTGAEGARYLAYFSNDAANPPANYQAAPFGQQYNVLNILDLATGQSTVAAQAGKGQGLEKLTWSPFNPLANPPGDKVYFTGGNYQNSAYISQPRLYTLQVNSNTVTEGPVLTTDPTEDIETVVVCTDTTNDTLFFVGAKADNGKQTLYSAPLNDLSQKKVLLSGSSVGLVGCVPPIS